MSGRVILLNGASSSGKSSIVRAALATAPEPFLAYSFDHLMDSGVLPLERIRSGDFDWARMRASVFDGLHRAFAGFAHAGNNMIIDHIVETPEWMADLVGRFAGDDVFFVGVRCPLEVLEHRETARGDRRPGDARRDHETVHLHAVYDLEVDGTRPPAETASVLWRAWADRTRPSAFERMASA